MSELITVPGHRLGCNYNPAAHAKTPKLADYMDLTALPPAPASRMWAEYSLPWGMLGNDTLQDCVPAAWGHWVMNTTADITANKGTIYPTLDQVIAFYSSIGKYVPGDPTTDNGSSPEDGAIFMMANGLAGVKLAACPMMAPLNLTLVRQTINILGCCQGVWMLPKSAISQIGGIWDLAPGAPTAPGTEPGSWGEHFCPFLGYDPNYAYPLPWGTGIQKATWRFVQTYCFVGFAPLSHWWVNSKTGKSPSGFNWQGLLAASKLL